MIVKDDADDDNDDNLVNVVQFFSSTGLIVLPIDNHRSH